MSLEMMLTVVGLVLVLEGLPYFIHPAGMREMASQVTRMPSSILRMVGLAGMLAGLLLVWVSRLG